MDLKTFLTLPLPAKLPASRERIDISDEQGAYTVAAISAPLSRGRAKEYISNFCDSNPQRPALTGVYYESEERSIIASNGFALAKIFSPSDGDSNLTNPKTGLRIDENFPDYQSIIPFYDDRVVIDDTFLFAARVYGVVKTNKHLTRPMAASIQTQAGLILLPADMLYKAITLLYRAGAESLSLYLSLTPKKAVVLRDDNTPGNLVVIMPQDPTYALVHAPVLVSSTCSAPDEVRLYNAESELARIYKEGPFDVSYNTKELAKAKKNNDRWAIAYHQDKLNKAIATRDALIRDLKCKIRLLRITTGVGKRDLVLTA